MAKTNKNYPAAQALIDKAMKVDPALAADIRAFARSREYGLVFEHNRPEAMRLYGKPVAEGDIVNILPERGKMESAENHVEWRVIDVIDGMAYLLQVEDEDVACEASVDDLVVVAEYDQPIYAGLRETDRVERGGGTLGDAGDKPYHVVINGENYHALEALEFCYAGKVDCIYIDPPYNTGAKDWKYNNDYVDGNDAYRHSKWLAWMERRLKLAKTLLNPKESVLILTIDEKEYLRVGLLLEQVFTEAKIQMISTVINTAGNTRGDEFSRSNEYVFFVRRGMAAPSPLPLAEVWRGNARNEKREALVWNQLMRSGTSALRSDRPNMFYPIFVGSDGKKIVKVGEPIAANADRKDVEPLPDTVIVWPIRSNGEEGRWRIGHEALAEIAEKGYVRLGSFTKTGMAITYLARGEQRKVEDGEFEIIGTRDDGSLIEGSMEVSRAFTPGTQWDIPSHNSTYFGSQLLGKVLGRTFPFPKSLYAVEDALRFFVSDKPNALVVDFFAGSGTTAHAVMRLNHQDGGHRRCISVTNNEVSEDETKKFAKKGLRQGDDEWEQHGIARYVTWPRVKAAITGMIPDGDPIKGEYGIKTEEYQEVEGDVLDPETGKKMRGKFFKKVKVQSKTVPDPFPMADGFDENAVFFDLTYEDPDMVEFGEAFEQVAPLLWMRAGCRGRIIEHEERDFAVADNYAVLFDYAYMKQFADAIESDDSIQTVYVVTDDDRRYANAKRMFSGRDVVRLYESYLHSFEIASEGALS